MKKNAPVFVLYFVVIVILLTILKVFTGSGLSTVFVFSSGILVFLVVFGATFMNEQYEEKHRGYAFLDTLPVTAREIVEAKFTLVFLATGFLVVFILLLYSFSSGAQETLVIARSYALLNAVICLILAGVNYIGVFILGFTKYIVIVMSGLLALGFIPMFLLMAYRDRMDILVENILTFYAGINWMIVFPAALAAYFVLMLTAAKVRHLKST
jgi:hypothetical protein